MQQPIYRQVGEVRITRVQELAAPGMRFIVPQATIDNLATIPWLGPFLAANGEAMGSVHALVLEVGERRILVDTCIGNDKERRMPPWNNRQGPGIWCTIPASLPGLTGARLQIPTRPRPIAPARHSWRAMPIRQP